MNELEYKRRMSQLPRERQPRQDLWPGIALRIAANPVPRRRLAPVWAAAAVIALGVGLLSWFQLSAPTSTAALATMPAVDSSAAAATSMARDALAAEYAGAFRDISRGRSARLSDLVGSELELTAAARELGSAQQEINRMLRQRPDAVFLVGLLNRNHQQQLRLARRGVVLS